MLLRAFCNARTVYLCIIRTCYLFPESGLHPQRDQYRTHLCPLSIQTSLQPASVSSFINRTSHEQLCIKQCRINCRAVENLRITQSWHTCSAIFKSAQRSFLTGVSQSSSQFTPVERDIGLHKSWLNGILTQFPGFRESRLSLRRCRQNAFGANTARPAQHFESRSTTTLCRSPSRRGAIIIGCSVCRHSSRRRRLQLKQQPSA